MRKLKTFMLPVAALLLLSLAAGIFTAGPALAQVIRAALTKNADDMGRAPFRFTTGPFFPNTSSADINVTTVPAGKRLVIKHINGIYVSDPTNPISRHWLGRDSVDDELYSLRIEPQNYITTAGDLIYSFNQPLDAIFEPGEPVNVRVRFQHGQPLRVVVTVTGYLVDLTL